MTIRPTVIQQIQNQPIVGATNNNEPIIENSGAKNLGTTTSLTGNSRSKNAPNSDPSKPNPATVRFNGARTDLRVKIEVPGSYLQTYTSGWQGNLRKIRGIVFPYTPQISIEHKADYNSQTPLHSNYAINFYKGSMISDISISGLFTVQNVADAVTYLSSIHLLRALTKGRFGGSDPLRGNPPPVCRLHAYGGFMLDYVPVAVTSFKQDLPNDVDYFYINDPTMGPASVPTRSTISVNLKPMFSRQEMLDANVPDWLSNQTQRVNGLL